jgi:hypothetical protein
VTCIEDAVFPVGEIDGKEDNLFRASSDDIPELTLSPSADAGCYLRLTPLPPGEQTLHWQARSAACGFGQDITYDLTVE